MNRCKITNPMCEDWGRLGDGDPNFAASALLEYGKMYLLSQGGKVNCSPVAWAKSTFRCSDRIWGVEFQWPKPLLKEYRFVFIFQFEKLPDLILANGMIVWEQTKDEAREGRVIFTYVPAENEPVALTFLKDASYQDENRPVTEIRFGDFSGCVRESKHQLVRYRKYEFRDALQAEYPKPVYCNYGFSNEPLAESDLTEIPRVSWQTLQVDVLNETIDAYLPELAHYVTKPSKKQIRNIIDTIPILEAAGINGMMLYHLDDELLEALAQSKLRSFIVETCSAGEWWGPCGSNTHSTRRQYQLGLSICNRLLARIKDCHVYIWFPEIDERQQDIFKSPVLQKEISVQKHGLGAVKYIAPIYNEFWRRNAILEANRKWVRGYYSKVIDPKRITTIYQAGCAIMISDFKNSGCDMTLNKSIFRTPYNITIATARGVLDAHEQPHGFDYDPWSWRIRMNHHPLEWRQGLLLFLHAGGKFLFHEGTLFRRNESGVMKPTRTGEMFCKTIRYARKHPSMGGSLAVIGAMQGYGDHTRHGLPRFMPQGAVESGNPSDWLKMQYRDWNLLELFFPRIGSWIAGNPERLMTGTPFGPLNILPPDIDLKHLQAYHLVFMPGTNGCTEEQFETLYRYVRQGGKLVLALGQLRKQGMIPRKLIREDLDSFCGIKVDSDSQTVNVTSAEVLHSFDNGDYLLKKEVGSGDVFLFTTNTLTAMGEDLPRKILKELAEPLVFVKFQPFSDWLEYLISFKRSVVCLSLFHHGQVGFPSGIGPRCEKWKGKMTIDLSRLNLAGPVAVKSTQDGYTLNDCRFEQSGNCLTVELEIDFWLELLIGSPETLEQDWFSSIE